MVSEYSQGRSSSNRVAPAHDLVEDSAKWAEGFVTHGELFKEMTVTSLDYTA